MAALANVSNLAEVSNYVALARDDQGGVIEVRLNGHARAAGFWPLLAALAQQMGSRDPDADPPTVVPIGGEDTAGVQQLDEIDVMLDLDDRRLGRSA